MITSNLIPLVIVAVVAIPLHYWRQKQHKDQEARLTAEELKTFNQEFRLKSRADIPLKYQPIRATSDKLRFTAYAGSASILAAIVFAVFWDLIP